MQGKNYFSLFQKTISNKKKLATKHSLNAYLLMKKNSLNTSRTYKWTI